MQARYTQGTLPNGLAFAADGSILISNFGTDRLEIMDRDGRTRTLIDNIDGQPIGKVNFVLRDTRDRVWLTVSTRVNPWTRALADRVRDGYVAVLEMAASAWWPTDFTSPTKSGSTPASNGCTSWKPPARASPACGWTSPGQAKSGWSTARSSAPPTWAACPTASRSTRTAICGPR